MTNSEIIKRVFELDLSIEEKKELIWELRDYKNTKKTEVFELNEQGQLISKTI